MNIIEQHPVYVSIAIFFLGIITAIIGFFIQRRFFSKAPKQSFKPTIHISSLTQDDSLYAEIYNVGNDPVTDLSVSTTWLQDGVQQPRTIYSFFNPEKNAVFASHHNCTFLNANEKKKMANLPKYSDDGFITFFVTGRGVNSDTAIDEKFTIQNEKK